MENTDRENNKIANNNDRRIKQVKKNIDSIDEVKDEGRDIE